MQESFTPELHYIYMYFDFNWELTDFLQCDPDSVSVIHYFLVLLLTRVSYWSLLFYTVVIEEGGVKMKLTVIDTPGFGDQINNENWWVRRFS